MNSSGPSKPTSARSCHLAVGVTSLEASFPLVSSGTLDIPTSLLSRLSGGPCASLQQAQQVNGLAGGVLGPSR